MEKTNVMRILDQNKIHYKSYYYGNTDAISGIDVAKALNQNPNQVFKTLVTVSKSKKYYVFLLPVEEELDLKKCAKDGNEKNTEMIHQKELLPLTGYIHGGCSPIGMKKKFTTVIDIDATKYDEIVFSAGKIGYQVQVNIKDIEKLLNTKFIDIKKAIE